MAVMVTLPTYHICLICTAIESPPQGGLPPQGEQKAYVTTVPRSTCVSQNRFFAILRLWLLPQQPNRRTEFRSKLFGLVPSGVLDVTIGLRTRNRTTERFAGSVARAKNPEQNPRLRQKNTPEPNRTEQPNRDLPPTRCRSTSRNSSVFLRGKKTIQTT